MTRGTVNENFYSDIQRPRNDSVRTRETNQTGLIKDRSDIQQITR